MNQGFGILLGQANLIRIFLAADAFEDNEVPDFEEAFVCALNFEMPRIAAIS